MKKSSSTSKFNIVLYLVLVGVIFALIFTTVVMVARLKKYLPDALESVLLIPEEPNFEIEDSNNLQWSNNTDIEVFSASYKNGKGEITVKSSSDDAVIAPGTSAKYKFYLKNSGNVVLDYSVLFNFDLSVGETAIDPAQFPVQVRIYNDYSGEYVVGNKNTYVPATSVNNALSTGTLAFNSYQAYVLQWTWAFDGGIDEFDTLLGSLAENANIVLSLNISTTATQVLDPSIDGEGEKLDFFMEEGGAPRLAALIVMVCLILGLTTLLGFKVTKRIRKSGDDADTDGDDGDGGDSSNFVRPSPNNYK
ncbi:MAG: hypothetical protein E7370_02705 [Clostridiales bacterium]|nr:hypothetical protein [Clostridiales bacterium]